MESGDLICKNENVEQGHVIYKTPATNVGFQWLSVSIHIIALILGLVAFILVIIRSHNNEGLQNGVVQTNNITKCRDCFATYDKQNYGVTGGLTERKEFSLPCCALTDTNVNAFAQKINEIRKRKYGYNQQNYTKSFTPVSAQKYLLSSNKAMNFSNVDHVTVQLNTSSNEKNSNNHARGVNIKHDGIEILHSGLYFVYSSIFYLPNTNVSSEHFPYQTWFHYVYRTRPNSPAMSSVILRTVFTCCPQCSKSRNSVYI
ncbi:hypothetical protein BgiBS90_013780, partial [Biomphalaria glabrata]